MKTRERRWIIVVALAMGTSCGHGPPERSVSLDDYATPNGTDVTIALRGFDVTRRARGLSAIPDGGFAITVDQGVEVNACHKREGTFHQIGVAHETVDSAPRLATPTIIAWLDTAVRLGGVSGKVLLVRLPADMHVGMATRQETEGRVLPECAKALEELRRSTRMPDGTAATPP
jgi:hypothetical protein